MITVRSTINLAHQSVPNIIPVVQGDTGRAILFTLADFTIPEGATARYFVMKPSGLAVYNDATIDGNTVLVELTAQSIIETGDNYGQVRISVGEDIVTSFDFILHVDPFRGIDAIESGTELNIFDQAVEEAVDDARERMEEAAEETIASIPEDYTALSNDVTALKQDLSEMEENIVSSGGMFPSSWFGRGAINTSGEPVASTYRVCSKEKFKTKYDVVVNVKYGFLMTLWLYPDNANAYKQEGGGFVIPKNTDAKIVIYRMVEDTTETADVEEFVSALLISLSDYTDKKISRLSDDIICDRYDHITYVDMLSDVPTLDRRTSKAINIDYDKVFHNNPFSIHMITASGSSATSSEIRFTVPTPFKLAGTQEFEMCIYIDNATNITNLSLRTIGGAFVKSNNGTIKTGWNKFRFYTEGAGTLDYTTDISTFRLIVTHSANTEVNIWIGSLVQVKPQYGNLVIIADGPYYTFYTEAYPTLKTNNIPVCWAVDGSLLDDESATTRNLIKPSELELLAMDGLSEFSFHSYDLTNMSGATANEALADTLKSIRFMKEKGLQPEKIWRAAWLQNRCAHPELANTEVDASCSYNGSAGVSMYPFPDRYNIARIGLQSYSTSDMDLLFNKLKNHRITAFVYTHGISTDSDRNLTPTMLAYFIDKIATGVSEGWLNPTTYNRLVNYYKRIV